MLKRPLLWCAAAFAAGLLFDAPDFPAASFGSLGCASLLGGLALAAACSSLATLRLGMLLVVGGFFCGGRQASLTSAASCPGDLAWFIDRHPALFSAGVDLAGRLSSPAPGDAPDEAPALLVDVDDVSLLGRRIPVRGRALLRLPPLDPGGDGAPPAAFLQRGRRIHVFARLERPRAFGNPGAFDTASSLKGRGVATIGSVKSWRLVAAETEAGAARGGVVSAWVGTRRSADDLRASLLAAIDRTFAPSPAGRRAAAVASALLVGERRSLDVEDLRVLQEAGLSHLLAVSGFNVAVLSALLFFLLRCSHLPARGAAAAVVPALLLYLLLNSDESSVERAVVMAVACLAGRMVWRRVDLANSLGLAALLILAGSPEEIGSAGFQLTFLATFALFDLAPRLARAMARSMGHDHVRRGTLAWIGRTLRVALAATLAVAAVTLPVTVLHFHRVSPGSIPANLSAGPMMAAAFVGTIALEAIAPLAPGAARLMARAVAALVDGTFMVARAVVSVPGMTYRRPTPGALLIGAYYLTLAALLSPARRREPTPLPRAVRWAALTMTLSILLTPLDTRQLPEGLRLTVLDVGQGDATLVETSGGERLLVDAGGFSPRGFDLGERVVAAALWHLGISSLDYLVVTHPDVDHAGGAASIVRDFHPRQVWLPAGSGAWKGRRAIDRLLLAIQERGVPLVTVARGRAACLAGARVEVLHPGPGEEGAGTRGTLNEWSLVLRVDSGRRRALLAADAGVETERRIAGASIEADFLKVGHHGSDTASSAEFLRRVAPRVAGVSCGRNNRFGHPRRDVLARLAAVGARVCRTDLHGAFEVELLPRGTRIGASCALGERCAP